MFYADLHIHSKYSRATSRDADLEHMAIWARKKGITVLGTGDFTHPAWMAEIRDKLVPAEPGLFRLRDDVQREVDRQCDAACNGPMRFMLEVEISTIYKKGEFTRKVHHLIYAPDLDKAERFRQSLGRIGNIESDGRPILGLDSRHLLEITLESGQGCYLIPAHIWTPWFAVLGSKSGFDSVEECYGDLSSEIFALETGLSSDPPMNWRLSSLDRYQLVSNSDAHSPQKIAREACAFETDMDYFSIRKALETGQGYRGTVEFFPEEGKYHLDGHRKCGIRQSPQETEASEGLCPVCGRQLTVGVMNRIDTLADRPVDYQPEQPMEFRSLIPLPEVISELRGVGEKSKRVQQAYLGLVANLGSELAILEQVPVEDIRQAGGGMLAEAVQRMRDGQVIRDSGYDGEYGRIRLFEKEELARGNCVSLLFEMPPEEESERAVDDAGQGQKPAVDPETSAPDCEAPETAGTSSVSRRTMPPVATNEEEQSSDPEEGILGHLDADQRQAAMYRAGPLLIIAGPGTGKTRTLTHRIAHLVADVGVPAEQCLAITFSRRAAGEMQERLLDLLPGHGERIAVMTFHALGLAILQQHWQQAGLDEAFRIASQEERRQLLLDTWELTPRAADKVLKDVSRAKRGIMSEEGSSDLKSTLERYARAMAEKAWLDFDDLIVLPTQLLRQQPEIAEKYRVKWPWICVDEFQDIDDGQYELVKQLAPTAQQLCAIGDPDQSIYGFRGANPHIFERFSQDFVDARQVQLTKNYRSSSTIVQAAVQAIAPSTLVENRTLTAWSDDQHRIQIQTCESDRAEAELVVHTIERLMGGSSFFSMDSGRVDYEEIEARSFNDFAVLYRTDAQAETLVEALSRSGIPFQKKSHRLLADEPAVAAMISLIQAWRQTPEESPSPNATATELLSQAAEAVEAEHPEVRDYFEQLVELARRCGDRPARLLEELKMGIDADLWDPRADRVSLSTLHASKGLEYPVVFLVGCENGVLPLRWSADDDANVEEERRLFFVGITRARQRLYLSHAKKRAWRGKLREMEVSPLLAEIREELLQRTQSAVRRQKEKPAETQLNLF